jgi:single-stranded-DNA-specific exonuclease
VIVNPNQPGCDFPSKALAGVGVMFYVMLALRAELRRRGAYADKPEPNLAGLLDLVALGTVADVVPLDRNNRILVAQGLARIRGGQMQAGVAALLPSPAASRPAPPPSTSASPSARASTPPAAWPTCRWASSAWSPTIRPAP